MRRHNRFSIFAFSIIAVLFIVFSIFPSLAKAVDMNNFHVASNLGWNGYVFESKTGVLEHQSILPGGDYGISDGKINVRYDDKGVLEAIIIPVPNQTTKQQGLNLLNPTNFGQYQVYVPNNGVVIKKSDTATLSEAVDLIAGKGSYDSVKKYDPDTARAQIQNTNELEKKYNALKDQYDQTPDGPEKDALKAKMDQAMADVNASSATQRGLLDKSSGNGPAPLGCTVSNFDIQSCVARVSQIMLQGSGFVLWLCAKLFDFSMDWGLNFKTFLDQSTIVDIGWKIFRDIANIGLIFVLLLVAIETIIGTSKFGSKSLIAKVIMAAFLINFSMFFTKVIIDASNIVALQFYGKMAGQNSSTTSDLGTQNLDGVAAAFMNGLKLQSIYSGGSQEATAGNLNPVSIMIIGFGGSLLVLVTSFIFLAGAVLFVIRTGILMILLMTSPIAFLAGAIPNASSQANKWWKTLSAQCLFAPVYMAMIYIVVSVVSTGKSFGFDAGTGSGSQEFSALFSGNPGSIGLLFRFGLIIFFMGASLYVATSLGAHGGKTAISIGKDASNWAGGKLARGTVGGLGNRIANSGFLRTYAGTTMGRALGGGIIGEALLKGGDKLSKLKIGDKSYVDKRKAMADERTNMAKLIENRTVTRHAGEADWHYNERVADIKKSDKISADYAIGISDKLDAKGNKKTRWLNFSKSGRDAQQQVIAARLKSKKSASEVASDTLETLVGKHTSGKDKGKFLQHYEVGDESVKSDPKNSALYKLKMQVAAAQETYISSTGSPEAKEVARLKLASLQERENKMIDRIESLQEKMKIADPDKPEKAKEEKKSK